MNIDLGMLNSCGHGLAITTGGRERLKKNFEVGTLDLKKLVHETPGSWAGMLTFQPPTRYCEVGCFGNYSADENTWYWIEAQSDEGLRIGDIIAVLAEAQNRQSRGVNRWAGIRHYDLNFSPFGPRIRCNSPANNDGVEMFEILKSLPHDFSVKAIKLRLVLDGCR